MFSLTRAGRKSFVDWVNRADDDFVGGVPPDPLRTRVRFLGLLDATSRNAFLRKARSSVERHLEAVGEDCERTMRERGLRNLVARGAFATMESRHRWLYEVEKELRNTSRKTK